MSDKIVLGYWAFRGRGQPLRHLASYLGLDFEEKLYKSEKEYKNDINSIGDFPNLPYLTDGDFKMSETLAIARYLVRKSGQTQLLGKTPADEATMDNFYYAFLALIEPILYLTFNKKVNDLKVGHFYKTKAEFNRLEKFLSGKHYVLDYLTIADFFVAEFSHYIRILYPDEFQRFKSISAIQKRVEALPGVQAYYQRPDMIITPFLSPAVTAIPMYWPGTQPKVPTPPGSPSKRATQPPPPPKVEKAQQKQQQAESIPQEQEQEPVSQKTQAVVSELKPAEVAQEIAPSNEPQLPESVDIELPVLEEPLRVVIISGSIAGSSPINYLLGQLTSFEQPTFAFEWADISSLEMHNEDIDEQGTQIVNALRGQVYAAHAVIFGLSETHGTLSAVLTNAYNWLVPVIKDKPVALVSMQCPHARFRSALQSEGIHYLRSPGLSVGPEFFDETGNLTESSYYMSKQFLYAFAGFIHTPQ